MVQALTHCEAREIKDSRGKATLEVVLKAGEYEVLAKVPSGKSEGIHEAVELRDPDGTVSTAIKNVNEKIAPALIGKVPNLEEFDKILLALDGTANKSNLGANAIIGTSIATLKLVSKLEGKHVWQKISELNGTEAKFPRLFMNMINGGVHAKFRLPFQEYIVVLDGEDPRQAFATGEKIFDKLGQKLRAEYGEVAYGDEGGYSPALIGLEKPFEILSHEIEGERAHLALDAAASELWDGKTYNLGEKKYLPAELGALYLELTRKFPLKSIEDPFAEEEKESFALLLGSVKGRVLVVGDDLTVTNPNLVKEAVELRAANAVIIKPDQVGTLTETFEAAKLAREAGWELIVSHRSGDTEDSFIADLAVGLGAYGLKAGSPWPPARKAKYERLIEISEKER